MRDRIIYRVQQVKQNSWRVMKDGFQRPHLESPSKEEAVRVAKRLAKTAQAAQVIVYTAGGVVESEQWFVKELECQTL